MYLTFVVLACSMNVAVPDEDSKGCKVFEEPILEEQAVAMTPMSCMMQSPPMVAKFAQTHPGWRPEKWTCKYVRPSQKI